jgi:alkanesulfonate monooxygenase SsuD/methylene tetrahydromethanopterin reductase-like flavin-dependent oxidoreductase (luciferase family)
MDIDIILEPGTGADEALRLGQLAEAAGIRTVWASSFPGRRDPFLSLVPLARASSRLRLGVLPISPFEKQPVKIADTLLTFNELCRGRGTVLVGGLGKSGMNAMGLEPARRVTATREAVEILRGVGRGAAFDYRGELYRAQHYHAEWATDAPPLVYVGANRAQMLRMATAVADGIMLSDATLPMLPGLMRQVDAGLAAAGRARGDLRLSNFFAWHIKEDRAAAMAEARQELVWRGVLQREYISSFLDEDDTRLVENRWAAFLQAFLQRTPVIEGVPDRIVEALVAHLTFTGGPEDTDRVVNELLQFQAAGLDEVALRMHRDADEAIRIIGERVVPALA